jgi:hypothetical protein
MKPENSEGKSRGQGSGERRYFDRIDQPSPRLRLGMQDLLDEREDWPTQARFAINVFP